MAKRDSLAQRLDRLSAMDRRAVIVLIDLLVVCEDACPRAVNDDLMRLIQRGARLRMRGPEVLALVRHRVESYMRDQT